MSVEVFSKKKDSKLEMTSKLKVIKNSDMKE